MSNEILHNGLVHEGKDYILIDGQTRHLAKLEMERRKTGRVKPSKFSVRRNSPCPCGSGKKFKYCHAKRNQR